MRAKAKPTISRKRQKEMEQEALLATSWQRGRTAGMEEGRAAGQAWAEQSARERKAQVEDKAIKALVDVAQALAHTAEAISQALRSKNGQL